MEFPGYRTVECLTRDLYQITAGQVIGTKFRGVRNGNTHRELEPEIGALGTKFEITFRSSNTARGHRGGTKILSISVS